MFAATIRREVGCAVKRGVQRCSLGQRTLATCTKSQMDTSPMNGSKRLDNLGFDNVTLRKLPVDVSRDPTQRVVPKACFALVAPTPVVAPSLVCHSKNALVDCLDIDMEYVYEHDLPAFVEYMAGNKVLPGAEPAAHCYCGHQFGYFSGQLGDGATMYLGELKHSKTGERWELQFKGAGKTPFSRTADGRKVLRSSLREFLCSEHMHALNIPTTRSATIITSQSSVVRDVFYNGNAQMEPVSVITRIAPTFLRFGSFEIFKLKDSTTGREGPSATIEKTEQMLAHMIDHTMDQYFPHISSDKKLESTDKRLQMFREIVESTAKLVAHWQCVGFCHGVLNTDNMSIKGLTIDYGPFGFMEHYDPDHVCNASDDQGRYRYRNQAEICKWNCGVLAEQLERIMPRENLLQIIEESYDNVFHAEYHAILRKKLGLSLNVSSSLDDDQLVSSLFQIMETTAADFTCTFRSFSLLDPFKADTIDQVVELILEHCLSAADVARKADPKVSKEQLTMLKLMVQKDPIMAQRHGITQNVVDKIDRDLLKFEEAKKVSTSEHRSKVRSHWKDWLEKYSTRLCAETNGTDDPEALRERRIKMNLVNPVYVLRNHVAQKAIEFATKGLYDDVDHIFHLLTHPFEESSDPLDKQYAYPSASIEDEILVT